MINSKNINITELTKGYKVTITTGIMGFGKKQEIACSNTEQLIKLIKKEYGE